VTKLDTRARILRVNHAGEHGAIRIYGAQIALAQWRYPGLLPFLLETLAHERGHLAKFRGMMIARGGHVCRLLSIWSVGGTALGLITGLLGRETVLLCTEAVERTVHRHLVEQQRYLARRDPELHRVIEDIRMEELQHLEFAIRERRRVSLVHTLLDALIAQLVEVLLWLSTRGDSSRMVKSIATGNSADQFHPVPLAA
jgi:3-demethoxyubiquinol 3-hydroxylase